MPLATLLAARLLVLLLLPLLRSGVTPGAAPRLAAWPQELLPLLGFAALLALVGVGPGGVPRRGLLALALPAVALGLVHADGLLRPDDLLAGAAAGVALAVLGVAAWSALARLPWAVPAVAAALLALVPPLVAGPRAVARHREVVVDLLDLAEPFEVVASSSGLAPHVGVLCPSTELDVSGGERRSIVVPPPGEVRLDLGSLDGEATLAAKAGVDLSVLRFATSLEDTAEFEFRVVRNGEEVAREVVTLRVDPEEPGSAWRPLWGSKGLRVRPGDVVTLETRVSVGGVELDPSLPVLAGFADLRLSRRSVRPRRLATPDAPNLVLVVVDTLRADHLSVYGYEHATTPVLEDVAARGVVFEEAYSTSAWTWPSTASLLTGLPPAEHGVVDGTRSVLARDLETLPEAMREAGWATAGWAANPLIARGRNFGQGFETFVPTDRFVGAASYFPDVLEWLERNGGERFFLYLHLVEPHGPWFLREDVPASLAGGRPRPSEEVLEELRGNIQEPGAWAATLSPAEVARADAMLESVYDAAVWSADRWIGELREALARLGLEERTVLAVTSDHGEELFDHGSFGHGHSVYAELVRVPLLLEGPGVPRGRRVTTPVSNRHLALTLADLAGAELTALRRPLDLIEELGGGEEPPAVLFSLETARLGDGTTVPAWGLRQGDWVLHALGDPEEPGGEHAALRLFQVERDPEQEHDVAASHPERVEALRARLEERLERMRPPPNAGPERTSVRELLEQLGYADQHGS